MVWWDCWPCYVWDGQRGYTKHLELTFIWFWNGWYGYVGWILVFNIWHFGEESHRSWEEKSMFEEEKTSTFFLGGIQCVLGSDIQRVLEFRFKVIPEKDLVHSMRCHWKGNSVGKGSTRSLDEHEPYHPNFLRKMIRIFWRGKKSAWLLMVENNGIIYGENKIVHSHVWWMTGLRMVESIGFLGLVGHVWLSWEASNIWMNSARFWNENKLPIDRTFLGKFYG